MNAITQFPWPELPTAAWRETYATLHLWTQIIGKIRLVRSPWLNHSWHVALYVSARGLTTSPIPYGGRTLEIDFDLIAHRLVLRTDDGAERMLPLAAQPVASFYAAVMAQLADLKMPLHIHTTPNEIADAVPFEQDTAPRRYEPEQATRLWQGLLQMDRVFKEFRARFIGKCSPVHFF